MLAWLRALDLRDITVFCQDWGGLVGLRLVAAEPARFAAVVASNTILPEGAAFSDGFQRWLTFSQAAPVMKIGNILKGGVGRALTAAEIAAYDAPFPDETYKAGARQFPTLVPIRQGQASVAENRAAWAVLERFERPFVTAFSDNDPVTAGCDAAFQTRIPGARKQAHVTLKGGHFVQEDAPAEIAALLHALAVG
jgi:haloalkane dehalogenase